MFSIKEIKEIFEKVINELNKSQLPNNNGSTVKYPFRSEEWFKIANSRRLKSLPLEKSVLVNGPKEWKDIRAWIENSKSTSELSSKTAYGKFWCSFTEEAGDAEEAEYFKTLNAKARKDLGSGIGTVRLPAKAEYHITREKAYGEALRTYCLSHVMDSKKCLGGDDLVDGSRVFSRFELTNFIFPPRRSGEISINIFSFIKNVADKHKPNYYCDETDSIIFTVYKNCNNVVFEKDEGCYKTTQKSAEVFEAFFSEVLPLITPLRIFIKSEKVVKSIIQDAKAFISENTVFLNKPANKKQEMKGATDSGQLWSSNDIRRFYETHLVTPILNREETFLAQNFLSHNSIAASIHYRKTDLEKVVLNPLPSSPLPLPVEQGREPEL